LVAWGVNTVGYLLRMDPRHLRRIHNLGAKSIKDIEDVLASMNLRVGEIPLKVEKPVKVKPVFKKKRANHAQHRHAYRRNKIYEAYKIHKLGASNVAAMFGITVARVYQIVYRVERERKQLIETHPNPIENARAAAKRMGPAEWLLPKEVQSEPSDDQSSGAASSGV
ncbi:MAG: DNA-directed RNA polymerase subunit alpha C-terminal domain-containing protein, partial [Prochlorotrichaceae cyanobacterium]